MYLYDDFLAYIETRFRDRAGAATPTVPVRWPNVLFEPPGNAIFVEWRMLTEEGFQAAMGSKPIFRHVGAIQIDVVSPLNSGTRAAADIGRKLIAPFSDQQCPIAHGHIVNFKTASSRAADEANNRQRLIVRAAYWRDVAVEREAF